MLASITLGTVGLLVTTIQGHATEEDVARVEKDSKARDQLIRDKLKDHTDRAEYEWRAQEKYREAMLERMNRLLGGIPPRTGGAAE